MGGIVFDEQVTAGNVLVREAIESQNYVAGVSGWIIEADGDAEFNSVTIRGALEGNNFIINDAGAFFYNGPPGNGNLIASIAAVAGVDEFGNAYSRVFNVGNQAGAHFGVDSFGTLYAVNAANQNVIQINPAKQALFVYSGTPASGNLIASVAATSGTDTVGNKYGAGFTTYGLDVFGHTITSILASGALTFANPAAPTLEVGEVSASTTFSPTIYRLQIFPPRPAGFAFPGIQMYCESALGAADDLIQIYGTTTQFPNTKSWDIGGVQQGLGPVGFAANQAPTGTTVAEAVAITTAAITWKANRAYRVTAHGLAQSTVAGDQVRIRVRKANLAGISLLDTGSGIVVPNTATSLFDPSAIFITNAAPPAATALAMTYQRNAGTGNVSVFASVTDPAYCDITDIGAASQFVNARLLT